MYINKKHLNILEMSLQRLFYTKYQNIKDFLSHLQCNKTFLIYLIFICDLLTYVVEVVFLTMLYSSLCFSLSLTHTHTRARAQTHTHTHTRTYFKKKIVRYFKSTHPIPSSEAAHRSKKANYLDSYNGPILSGIGPLAGSRGEESDYFASLFHFLLCRM